MVIPCGKHRGIERTELLRRFPSYALWAHRTVDWVELTPFEEAECKRRCVRKVGLMFNDWDPWFNYDELTGVLPIPRRVQNVRRLRWRRWQPYVTPDDEDWAGVDREYDYNEVPW